MGVIGHVFVDIKFVLLCVSFLLSLLIGSAVLFVHVEFLPVITCYCSVGLGIMCICMFDVLVYVLNIDLVHILHILFQTDTCVRATLAAFSYRLFGAQTC